jgi:hypothetical protein
MRYRSNKADDEDALEFPTRSLAAHLEFAPVYKARSPPRLAQVNHRTLFFRRGQHLAQEVYGIVIKDV